MIAASAHALAALSLPAAQPLYFTWGRRELPFTCVYAAAECWLTVSGDKRKARHTFLLLLHLLHLYQRRTTAGWNHEAGNTGALLRTLPFVLFA